MLSNFIKSIQSGVVPATNDRYLVKITGEIVDLSTNTAVNVVDGQVSLLYKTGLKTVSVAVVVASVFKPIYKSDDFIYNWDIVHLNGDRDDVHPSNLVWRPPPGGQTIQESDGFYVEPITGRYAVSRDGLVFDRFRSMPYNPTSNVAGYLMISFKGYNGERSKVGVHRAVALALLPYDRNINHFVVNHKNGDKTANHVDNLEFVSHSVNNAHSMLSGLRDVLRPVRMLDLFTEEESKFASISDAARYLSVNSGSIHKSMFSNPFHPILDRYVFKPEDAHYGWPKFDMLKLREMEERKKIHLSMKECMAMDIREGKLYVAPNPSELSKLIGFTVDEIKTALRIENGGENTRTPRIWPYKNFDFRWLNHKDTRPYRQYSNEEIEAFKDKVFITKPLKVKHVNGSVKIYCSLYDLSLDITTPSRPHIKKMLEVGGGKYKFDNFEIEYLRY